jgi:hypothetical protein
VATGDDVALADDGEEADLLGRRPPRARLDAAADELLPAVVLVPLDDHLDLGVGTTHPPEAGLSRLL